MLHQSCAIIIRVSIVVAKNRQILILAYLFCDNAPCARPYPYPLITFQSIFIIINNP